MRIIINLIVLMMLLSERICKLACNAKFPFKDLEKTFLN